MDNGRVESVAETLYRNVYEAKFRGKSRGRFCLTRDQMRAALGVERLHSSTIKKLQEEALEWGLVVIDLDDVFPCIETQVLRRLRRPPRRLFRSWFPDEAD